MSQPDHYEDITAATLGLRELPRAWRGATAEQLISSAQQVVEQSEAIGGSRDPRLLAALKVLELKDRLQRQTK